MDYLSKKLMNMCQIYAIRDEKTVFDDCWRGFRTDDAVNVNSVTKGVMALLAGIALDQGRIKSVDQKVLDKYTSEPWTKVCTSGDWTLAVLDFLGGRKGITGEFQYATLGIPEHVIHGDSSKEDQFDFYMNNELFHGMACLIKLTDGEENFWETPKAGRVQVTGAGMS